MGQRAVHSKHMAEGFLLWYGAFFEAKRVIIVRNVFKYNVLKKFVDIILKGGPRHIGRGVYPFVCSKSPPNRDCGSCVRGERGYF